MAFEGREPRSLNGCEVLPPVAPSSVPLRQHSRGVAAGGSARSKKSSSTGRFQILNNFIDFTSGSLSRSELLVWFVLFRDTRNGVARTSQKWIAQRAGISDRTVRRALKRLEDRGLVIVVSQGGLGVGASSYRVMPLQEDPKK